MTAVLQQHSFGRKCTGQPFGSGIQSAGVLPIVQRLASKGDIE